MTSEARIAANRRNAVKSTGPKTTVGKAIVAQNAIKHGLFARQDVIAEEEPQQYQDHRQGLLAEMSPANQMETFLAERIVSLTWRLQRAERLQNELYDFLLAREVERSLEDFPNELSATDQELMRRSTKTDPALAVGRMLARDYEGEKMLDRLTMHERRIEGSLYRTMHELDRCRLAREHRPPVETQGFASPQGTAAPNPCHAKQSQSAAEDGGHSTPCGAGLACETNPIGPVGPVCSVPARASEETPGGVTTSDGNCAKQSQSPA